VRPEPPEPRPNGRHRPSACARSGRRSPPGCCRGHAHRRLRRHQQQRVPRAHRRRLRDDGARGRPLLGDRHVVQHGHRAGRLRARPAGTGDRLGHGLLVLTRGGASGGGRSAAGRGRPGAGGRGARHPLGALRGLVGRACRGAGAGRFGRGADSGRHGLDGGCRPQPSAPPCRRGVHGCDVSALGARGTGGVADRRRRGGPRRVGTVVRAGEQHDRSPDRARSAGRRLLLAPAGGGAGGLPGLGRGLGRSRHRDRGGDRPARRAGADGAHVLAGAGAHPAGSLQRPPGGQPADGPAGSGFVEAVARLYEAGAAVAFEGLFAGESRRRVALPG